MFQQKYKLFLLNIVRPALLIAVVVFSAFVVSLSFRSNGVNASAGIYETINFQGRLLDDTGAVVPDGTYNIEFKIYQDGDGDLGGGDETLQWTETRESGNKVVVKNGYFSVYLGSVTAFASSVDWNQDTLWLTINIGGTGSPSYDGEMDPFTRLSSTPYALNSKALGGLEAASFVQLAQGLQTDGSSTNPSIYINKNAATANIIQLQRGGTDVFTISNGGSTTFKTTTDSTTGFQVMDADGGTPIFNVDTTNERVGIGIAAPTEELDLVGDALISSKLQVGGSAGGTISQCFSILGVYTCDIGLEVLNDSTNTTTDTFGESIVAGVTASGSNSAQNVVSSNTLLLQGTQDYTLAAGNTAINAAAIAATSGTVTRIDGVLSVAYAGAGTVTTAVGVSANAQRTGGTLTTGIGLQATANFGAMTSSYGIKVEAQTNGTNNYGIAVAAAGTQTLWIASDDATATTAAKGIAFGSGRDVNLYRSAADTLRTDDALIVGSNLTVSGAGASTVAGTLDIAGHAAIGNGATIDGLGAPTILTLTESITDSAALGIFNGLELTANDDGATAFGIMNSVGTYGSNTFSNVSGMINEVSYSGTSTLDTLYGEYISVSNGSSGAVDATYGLYVELNPSVSDTTAVGIAVTGANNATNSYGIVIDEAGSQTLWLTGDGATGASGIGFGGSNDTNLYRSAANTLKTDDNLVVALDATITGGDLTLGAASTTNGALVLQNSTNAFAVTISAANQATGSATITIPNTAGVADTFCLQTVANCAGGSGTLQNAYDNGNTIVADDGDGDIDLTLNDARNFSVDIVGTGGFLVQDGGTNVLSIDNTGDLLYQSSVDSVTGFQVKDQDGGTSILNIDTTNERVGIGIDAPTEELDVVGDILASGKLQVGGSGAGTVDQCMTVLGLITCDTALEAYNESTQTANASYGASALLNTTAGSASAASNIGMYSGLALSGTQNYTAADNVAVRGEAYAATAGTVTQLLGVQGTAFSSAGTLTTGIALQGRVENLGGTYTTGIGLRIQSSVGTIANNYGIQVQSQTSGTTDYGIAIETADTQTLWIASNDASATTAAKGIAFGSARDVNLYRSAANTLTTDDNFNIGTQITTDAANGIMRFTPTSGQLIMGNYAGYAISGIYGASGDANLQVAYSNSSLMTLLGFSGAGFVFGAGGASTVDTALYRNAATSLRTSGHFTVDGTLNIGSDTSLYRSAADTISTDDKLVAGMSLDTGNLVDLNLVLSNDGDVDTVSALNVDVTSASTGDADLLYGINIGNLTSADGTVVETALRIGTGWDVGLSIESGGINVSSGQIVASNQGVEFTDSDTNPTCAAGNYNIYADLSENKLKKCVNGTVSDVDAGNKYEIITADSTWTKPADALLVILEMWGAGGGGGGGAGGTNAAARTGGSGGGGGAFVTGTFLASNLGSTVEVTVGTGGTSGTAGSGAVGGNGGVGNSSCFSTTTGCAGTMVLRAYGGGGGRGATATGNGGGGGGGAEAAGSTGASGTGGAGGNPLASAANTANSGGGGAGGGTAAATGAAGGASFWGGSGGGSSSSTGAGNSGAGGMSTRGGAGGGGGGSCAITTCTARNGGAGGASDAGIITGGAAGTAGGAGGAGTDGVNAGGSGGGGGANSSSGNGGDGADGGAQGGGGGGGGGAHTGSTVGGAGADGGRGEVHIWSIKGNGADLAEIYSTRDPGLEPGDVVCLDSTLRAGVKKCENIYDSNAVGVVTTNPGLVIGDVEDPGAYPVAVVLSGRTPVKVSTENGLIKAGDLLAPSSIPGVAMKATKAGQIVGQAMNGLEGEGVGYVLMFAKTDLANGASLANMFGDEAYTEEALENSVFGRQMLTYLASEATPLSAPSSLSEVVTDRVVAGLEIISPKIVTDELLVNSIEAATGTDVNLKLSGDGQFVVTNPAGESAITFDSNGNAQFAGTITADKIQANQVEGLEIFTNKISSLASKSDDSANQSSTTQTDSDVVGAAPTDSIDVNKLKVASATVTLDLDVDGSLVVGDGLTINGPAEFNGTSIFNKLATFIDRVIFRQDVEFVGTPTFNNDTGGFAVISPSQQEVEVRFNKEYDATPVVSLTVKNGQFVQYAYKDLSSEGFTIILSEPATEKVEFAWTALSVESAETSQVTVAAPSP